MRLRSARAAVALLCAMPAFGQRLEKPDAPLISSRTSYVIAHEGRSYLFDPAAGIERRPFLEGVYRPFGFSFDSRRFLYLKSNGTLPGFALYSHDLDRNQGQEIAPAVVTAAAWSPVDYRIAYISMSSVSRFQVRVYDPSLNSAVEIYTGRLVSDSLRWSPDGSRLLFTMVERPDADAIHTRQFRYRLMEYNLEQGGIRDAGPGRTGVYRKNRPAAADGAIEAAASGDHVYTTTLEDGAPAVRRTGPDGRTESVGRGSIYWSTEEGVVIRRYTTQGLTYEYLSNDSRTAVETFSAQIAWKLPYGGSAYLVQGGDDSQDTRKCDGGYCRNFLTAHYGTLGYALDFQQRQEEGQGNKHVLATASGTVVAFANNVTCNGVTTTCNVGYDDYSSTCNDNDGAGNYVVIAHADGTYSFYGHLKSASVQVGLNQAVTQGKFIAIQGHTGAAGTYNNYLNCGDHIHFQRQTGPGVWDQSVPTDFSETPCAMDCPLVYTSANVEGGSSSPALSMTLNPPTVAGAATTTGNQVSLPAPAPAGGTVVTLSSSNPSLASVPASVTIPASATSAAFPITVQAVSSNTTVTIGASAGSSTTQQVLTLQALAVSLLTLSQSSAPAGTTVPNNRVDLNGAAGPSGFTVSLASSNSSAASVPPTATVSGGGSSVLFSITTGQVSSNTSVTISASGGGTTKTQNFTVTTSVPGAPANPSPANGATGIPVTTSLSWSAVSGAASYDVYFGTSSNPPFAGNTSATSFSPGTLSSGTQYYWRVAAKNASGATTSATWTFTTATAGGSTFTPIRVYTGWRAYTDPSGQVWSADTGYTGGRYGETSASISNTSTPVLYQYERWGDFTYNFSAPAGSYNVTLKFAEIFWQSSGQRVFNVSINGQAVLTNFDIIAQAGGPNIALDRTFSVSSVNGLISIAFSTVVDNAKVSAIEIVGGGSGGGGGQQVQVAVSPTSASLSGSQSQQFTATVTGSTNTAVTWSINPQTGTLSANGNTATYTAPASVANVQTVTVTATSVADGTRSAGATVTLNPPATSFAGIRVNSGEGSYTDPQGRLWSADTGFTGGRPGGTSASIANTTTPYLYQSERWGDFTYVFNVPSGTYTVILKFAEIFWQGAGQRIFNVAINGQTVLSNFDVLASAGGPNIAIDRSFTASSVNGQIAIQFTTVVDNAKISAIEIR